MVENVQDFRAEFPLVNPETGLATPEFLRFIKQRGGNVIDASSEAAQALIVAQQAQAAVDDLEDNTIVAGTGLSGGGSLSSSTITIDLEDTAVTPGSYTNTSITVDQQGRITAASNGSGGGSGALTFLDRVEVTTGSEIDLPFSDSYDSFYIEVYLNKSASADLFARITDDNFTSVESGASDYLWNIFRYSNTTGSSVDTADSEIQLIGGTVSGDHSGIIRVINSKESARTTIFWDMSYVAANPSTAIGTGQYTATTSINGLRLFPSTGTITGFAKIWGRSV